MDTIAAKEAAIRLLETRKMGTWSLETLTMWLEADCGCVYCERYMLEDRGIAYFFSHGDHILPKEKYRQLRTAHSNLVLSCQSCNTLKCDWDPNSSGEIVIEPARNELSLDERSLFIGKIRYRLEQLRTINEAQFKIEKKAIEDCLADARTTSIVE